MMKQNSHFGWVSRSEDGVPPPWNKEQHQRLLTHGFLVVRDVRFVDRESLVRYASTIGKPVEYKFGAVLELREERAQRPKTQLSNRAMCIHQDSLLPETFVDMVLMYCWSAPCSGGECLFSDNRDFMRRLQAEEPELYRYWRSAQIRYRNHTADYYKEGNEIHEVQKGTTRVHPFLQERMPFFAAHDEDEDDGDRNFTATFVGLSDAESRQKMARLSRLMRHEDTLRSHALQAGDLIFFDNLLVSHGRNGFPAGEPRLLHRVQLELPTDSAKKAAATSGADSSADYRSEA